LQKKRNKNKLNLPHFSFWEKLDFSLIGWGIIFLVLVFAILATALGQVGLDLKVNEPSPRDVVAPYSTFFVSEVATAELKQKAAESVEPVYEMDNSAVEELIATVNNDLATVRQTAKREDLTPQEKEEFLGEKGFSFSAAELERLAAIEEEEFTSFQNEVDNLIYSAMQDGIRKEAVEETRLKIIEEVNNSSCPSFFKNVVTQVLEKAEIRPNLVYNNEVTQELIEKAQNEVDPVIVNIQQGEIIVRQGEIVTPSHLEKMEQLGLVGTYSLGVRLFGLFLLVLLVFLIFIIYLYQYQKDVWQNQKYLKLLGLILVITLAVARFISLINIGSSTNTSAAIPFLAPFAFGAMLVAILLNPQIALFFTLSFSLLVGTIFSDGFGVVLVAVISSLAGIFSLERLTQRADLIKSSVYISLAAAFTVLTLALIQGKSVNILLLGILMAFGNGVLSAILAIGILPFLESAFGIATTVRLLELSNPNRPLLKALLTQAPGTYHHSVMVGNLAEAAAQAIGADTFLVRAGAYYHDIGKIKRPYFFAENQFSAENPHDRLAPSLSTLIVTSHIKDGLEMGKKEGLPPELLSFIAQHHGTSKVSFFYQKALDANPGESLPESDFRYEGPKPQTKEAAIVMLADAVEAGARSLTKPTPQRLESFVRKIIKEKMEDGQLDNSNLTLKELDVIADVFVRILTGIYHPRIEYPQNEEESEKGGEERENERSEDRPDCGGATE